MQTNNRPTEGTQDKELFRPVYVPILPIAVKLRIFKRAAHPYIVYCTFDSSPLQVERNKKNAASDRATFKNKNG